MSFFPHMRFGVINKYKDMHKILTLIRNLTPLILYYIIIHIFDIIIYNQEYFY